MNRLAVIITAIAAMLSGGGVARYAHMIAVHGGHACMSACAGQAHAHAATTGTSHAPVHDDCPVCDELAVSAPAPSLHAPFASVIAVLAIVHDREAAQLPAPDAPRALAARPPPRQA